MTQFAQNYPPQCAAPYQATPLGYQQITSFASATNLTVPADATFALIQVEGVAGTDFARWRDDGVAPTTSVGMLVDGTNSATTSPQPAPFLYAGDLTKIQFISSGSPKLNISYYS
jgi:hypothetical protein